MELQYNPDSLAQAKHIHTSLEEKTEQLNLFAKKSLANPEKIPLMNNFNGSIDNNFKNLQLK